MIKQAFNRLTLRTVSEVVQHLLHLKSDDHVALPFLLSQVLAEMFKVVDTLKPLMEEWGSDPTLQRTQPHPGSQTASGRQDDLLAVTKGLEQAWGRSLHCQLQLWTRLEMLLDWSAGLQQDGGTLGEEMLVRGEKILNNFSHLLDLKKLKNGSGSISVSLSLSTKKVWVVLIFFFALPKQKFLWLKNSQEKFLCRVQRCVFQLC